jgi:nitrous oxidase accessory protein NosD
MVINDVAVTEGNAGTVGANFTVTLSTLSPQTVTVSFSTALGTATAGNDYISSSGTLTFVPGENIKTVTIMVNGDATPELDEAFFVNLSSATNATVTDGQGMGTIINDDTMVSVNCPADSLQTAINQALPGNSVLVSGTCRGNVLIRNEKQRVTLDGGGIAILDGADPNSPVLNVRGKGILIQGFTITGGRNGIEVNRGSNVVINNNVIQASGGHGILVNQLAFAVITNNTIQNNPRAQVMISEESSARIGFNDESETLASPNAIQNNGVGVMVIRSSSARVIGNAIFSNGGDGFMVTTRSSADISDNAIDNNGGLGIFVGENSVAQLGEDSGTSIYQLPNTTSSNNGGFGVACTGGGIVDGRLGTLNGAGGVSTLDSTCVNDLL